MGGSLPSDDPQEQSITIPSATKSKKQRFEACSKHFLTEQPPAATSTEEESDMSPKQ